MHANIIGSGIAGPMAAITLRVHGYDVDVWEQRAEQDLHSDGVLGITHASWKILQAYGTDAEHYSMPVSGHDSLDGLVWTDLHNSLTRRAVSLGASFHYGQTFTGNPADLTVVSTGVGSAKEVSKGHYTGYTIIRGLAYQFSGSQWTDLSGYTKDFRPWYFMGADIRTGTSVAMFVPRDNPTLRTTYSNDAPEECRFLPPRWSRLIETVKLWQHAPLSDWDVPAQMIYRQTPHHPAVRIGDANGQLRPMTAMGANRALAEASDVQLLIDQSGRAENRLLAVRRQQHDEGLESGVWLGIESD